MAQIILQNRYTCASTGCPHFFFHFKKILEVKHESIDICLEQRIAMAHGQMVKLTVKEFNILALLMKQLKRVFTYEMMNEMFWQEEYASYSCKEINYHVSNLRKKLKIFPDSPDDI